MKTQLRLVLSAFAIAITQPIFAGQSVVLNAALYYGDIETESGSSKVQHTHIIYNLGLGIKTDSDIFLGLKYFDYDVQGGVLADDDETETSTTAMGLTVGYMHRSGFTILASYLTEPEKEIKTSGGTSTFKGGDGTIIDIGYLFNIKTWAAGPQISIAELKYDEIETSDSTTELGDDYTEKYTYPYLSFFFYF